MAAEQAETCTLQSSYGNSPSPPLSTLPDAVVSRGSQTLHSHFLHETDSSGPKSFAPICVNSQSRLLTNICLRLDICFTSEKKKTELSKFHSSLIWDALKACFYCSRCKLLPWKILLRTWVETSHKLMVGRELGARVNSSSLEPC